MRIVVSRGLGHLSRHVAAVDAVNAERHEAVFQAGVADRRRTHVDASPARPEVERRADDRGLHLTTRTSQVAC